MGLPFAFISLIKFTFLVAVLAHWLACVWGFMAVKPDDPNWAWLSYADGLSWRQKAGIPNDASEWRCAARERGGGGERGRPFAGYLLAICWPFAVALRKRLTPPRPSPLPATVQHCAHRSLYGVALYVALNNIFGGACEINPGSYGEFYAQAAMLLLGSSVWAYVIGSACASCPDASRPHSRAPDGPIPSSTARRVACPQATRMSTSFPRRGV